MLFKYKAHKAGATLPETSEGKLIEGQIEAADKFALSKQLRDQGMVLVSVEEAGRRFDWARLNEVVVSVKLHDKVVFANNLSAMISAGLSLSRALDILARQTTNPKFKRTILEVVNDVNAGTALSVSMSKFPNIFSSVFVAMVAAGEESGNLPESLKLVGDQMEKVYVIQRKVKGAMIYPSVIVGAMGIVGALMLIFVVPSLVSTFKEFNVPLPLPTKIVIGLSDLLVNYWLYTMIFLAIVIFSLYKALKTVKGKKVLDFIILHLPLISGIAKQMNSATIARTLSSLIVSGVNMVESIEITSRVVQNSFYKEVLGKSKEGVEKGEPLSKFFVQNSKLFPILVGELTEVGEETGKLGEMLANVATFYENEVEAVTRDMSTIIEPILMIVIATFVGFFAVSMIQPIYSITEAI